jgi:hypothetical protein
MKLSVGLKRREESDNYTRHHRSAAADPAGKSGENDAARTQPVNVAMLSGVAN